MTAEEIAVLKAENESLKSKAALYDKLRAIVTNDMRSAGHQIWPHCDCPYTDIYIAMQSANTRARP